MTQRSATVTLEGNGLKFRARTDNGHELVLDDAAGDAGPRPADLIALALAGCTAFDVISILRKKRQDVTGYRVLASATQRDDPPHVFTEIVVTHVVEGALVDVDAVRRSIELSATRYCSVGATVSSGVTCVKHRYVVRTRSDEFVGDVVTIGPNDALEYAPTALVSAPTAPNA